MVVVVVVVVVKVPATQVGSLVEEGTVTVV
jgi:hypothetical protein